MLYFRVHSFNCVEKCSTKQIVLTYQTLGEYRQWMYQDEFGLRQIGGYVQDYFRMNFVLVQVRLTY